MRFAAGVFAILLMWAVVFFFVGLGLSSYRQARREGRPVPPWWFWALIALLSVVLGVVFANVMDKT